MALASSLSLIANDNSPKAERSPRIRFSSIVDLETGKEEGAAAQTDIAYEEYAFFGFARGEEFSCPAAWLGKVIERAGRMAMMKSLGGRPLSIIAPAAALAHPDAPMAAEAGAARAQICPQEVRLEFADFAIVEEDYSSVEHLYDFHRRGFRLGLDARSSWKTAMDEDLRYLIEAVRVDAHTALESASLLAKLERSPVFDVMVFAENLHWRDARKLTDLGVTHGISPKSDS